MEEKKDAVRQATRAWFSQWPRLEIHNVDMEGVYTPEGAKNYYHVSPEVPVVAIVEEGDRFDASSVGLVLVPVCSVGQEEYRAFMESTDEIRTLWRKDGGKCIIGKARQENRKDISSKRDFVARMMNHVRNEKCDRIVFLLGEQAFFDAMDAALSLMYRYDCFRQVGEKEAGHPLILSVFIGAGDDAEFQMKAAKMNRVMESVFFARDLVNRPPSEKKPVDLSEAICMGLPNTRGCLENDIPKHLFSRETVVSYRVMGLDFDRMRLVHAVCKGSGEEPCVLVGEYRHPEAKNTRPIVLVGKGVCFDSGGINIKGDPRNMKGDMAGAAVVFGILRAAALLELPVHLVAMAPFVYNMPSGSAYRPDDVIASYNGKTVEIGNTDAEGRLILADVLAYAVEKYNPELIVDYATLTGACVAALGTDIAGIFTSAMDAEGEDWELTRMFVRAGQETDEPHWPLPLYEPYFEKMKSNIANMNNMASDAWGGAITAALFLKQFVGDTPWKHVDIAGPDIFAKSKRFWPDGANGFGVRSGVMVLEMYLESKIESVERPIATRKDADN